MAMFPASYAFVHHTATLNREPGWSDFAIKWFAAEENLYHPGQERGNIRAFKKDIRDALHQPSIRWIFVPMTVFSTKGQAHANGFIVDKVSKRCFRFDPMGNSFPTLKPKPLDRQLGIFWMPILNPDMPQYVFEVKQPALCVQFFQELELPCVGIRKQYVPGGLCQLYVILFFEFVFSHEGEYLGYCEYARRNAFKADRDTCGGLTEYYLWHAHRVSRAISDY